MLKYKNKFFLSQVQFKEVNVSDYHAYAHQLWSFYIFDDMSVLNYKYIF